MKVTYNWLKELTNTSLTVEEIAERLTMLGLEVEGIYPTVPELEGVVIGEVLDVQPVRDSDYLKVCRVNLGAEQLQIICGAPNVASGQKVPVAVDGARLPGGMTIQTKKIRGIVSQGMICSEAELGLSDDAEGIMVLDDSMPVGESLKAYLGKKDFVIELSVTPNRPDCLGAIGVARELALSEGKSVLSPLDKIALPETKNEPVRVDISAPERCPRYTARLIRNVKIGPSPRWLVDRLRAIGLRSINNVVDVTNYVMMETGQPLHAFDYDRLQGGAIVVRTAEAGETFVTLDGKEHKLQSGDLLICDAERPVALAGIMGGENSEVSQGTTHILLESAYFAPAGIRKTARQLGISTESSRRFERGVDPNGVDAASNRAAQLILETAGGELASELIDVYPEPIVPVEIAFRPQRCRTIIGLDIPDKTMNDIFTQLGCQVREDREEQWQVMAPTFRPDLTREIDLIEEVARIYGYNEVPDKIVDTIQLDRPVNPFDKFIDTLRSLATAVSLNEVITISMVAESLVESFVGEGYEPVRLLNPLSEDMAVMRPSLLVSMLSSVAYNLNRKQEDIRFFEVGNIFAYETHEKKIVERKALAGIVTGFKFRPTWQIKPQSFDFYDLKGIAFSILQRSGLRQFDAESTSEKFLDYGLDLLVEGQKLGYIGKLSAAVLDRYEIRREVYAFEFDLERLYDKIKVERRFKPIPAYPPVERDLALVLNDDIPAGAVEDAIRESAGPWLKQLTLFDVFRGKQIPQGKKSLAFSLIFQSEERTLRDEEVNEAIEHILQRVAEQFGATLRT